MQREPQNDLRYIKTENLIQETFRTMLLEMDYAQISIKELTERALINRKTFYLHYNSLDELLGKLQSELYQKILQSISDVKLPRDLEKLVRTLFLFWAHTDGVNEKILCSQGNFPIGKSPGDYARKMMFHHYHPDNQYPDCSEYEINIIDAYLSGSFIAIYTQWLADGRKIPLENIIHMAAQLIAHGLYVLEIPK